MHICTNYRSSLPTLKISSLLNPSCMQKKFIKQQSKQVNTTLPEQKNESPQSKNICHPELYKRKPILSPNNLKLNTSKSPYHHKQGKYKNAKNLSLYSISNIDNQSQIFKQSQKIDLNNSPKQFAQIDSQRIQSIQTLASTTLTEQLSLNNTRNTLQEMLILQLQNILKNLPDLSHMFQQIIDNFQLNCQKKEETIKDLQEQINSLENDKFQIKERYEELQKANVEKDEEILKISEEKNIFAKLYQENQDAFLQLVPLLNQQSQLQQELLQNKQVQQNNKNTKQKKFVEKPQQVQQEVDDLLQADISRINDSEVSSYRFYGKRENEEEQNYYQPKKIVNSSNQILDKYGNRLTIDMKQMKLNLRKIAQEQKIQQIFLNKKVMT